MQVGEVLRKVSRVLNDEDFVRWTLPELVGWLNDGLVAIVKAQPLSNAETIPITLEEGTLQRVPDDVMQIIRITRNLKDNRPDARLGMRSVSVVDRQTLDAWRPNWHDPEVTPYQVEVKHVIYDDANNRVFYVYPGNVGTGVIEAIVTRYPNRIEYIPQTDVDSYTMETGLRPEYDDTLQNYILFRALSKDAPYAEAQMAQVFLQLVANDLGSNFQVQMMANPNRKSPAGPANP